MTTPAPISIAPSEVWDGNDGRWTSFPLQLGNGQAAENVRVLASTKSPHCVVVNPNGCPANSPPNCASSRGMLYDQTTTGSWVDKGIFAYSPEANLGFGQNISFGYENITIGWQGSPASSMTPDVPQQVLASYQGSRYWVGLLGLLPIPTNFSNFNGPQTSLISSLRDQRAIPSTSYGYGEGAIYALNGAGVYSTLTLGGYDALAYIAPGLSLPFYPATANDLTVAIQSIMAPNISSTDRQSSELLPQPINTLIDSTLPYIWLPLEACIAFESAFGLTWDTSTELYTLTERQHATLLAANPTITFTLGQAISRPVAPNVQITLPYAAFDLNASFPIASSPSQSIRYFPLKQAANSTQYVLGRAFMQEAYLIADYERQNFTIAQRRRSQDRSSLIVAIRSLNEPEPASSSHGLSGGAIAGIVIGVILGLALVGAAIFFFFWRKRRSNAATKTHELEDKPVVPIQKDEHYEKAELPSDVDGGYFSDEKARRQAAHEMHSPPIGTSELASPNLAHELPSPPMVHELEAEFPQGSPRFMLSPLSPSTPAAELEDSTQASSTTGTNTGPTNIDIKVHPPREEPGELPGSTPDTTTQR